MNINNNRTEKDMRSRRNVPRRQVHPKGSLTLNTPLLSNIDWCLVRFPVDKNT